MLEFITNNISNIAYLFVTPFSAIYIAILKLLEGLFPSVDPSNLPFATAIATIMELGYEFSFVIPWQSLFLAFSFIIGWEVMLFGIKFIKWVLERIH